MERLLITKLKLALNNVSFNSMIRKGTVSYKYDDKNGP